MTPGYSGTRPSPQSTMQLHLNFTIQRDVYIRDHSKHASYSQSCNTTNTGFHQLPMTHPYSWDESRSTATVPDPEGLLASQGRACAVRGKKTSANDKPRTARKTPLVPFAWVPSLMSFAVRLTAVLLAMTIGFVVFAVVIVKTKNV